MLKHRNRSLEGLDEYASSCFQSICSFVLSAYSDNAEYELDELVNAPALPPLPEKDDVPVPEFDAIAHLIPEKQRMFLKVHQKEGVAFMHKRIIAVPEDHRGCILAHSMGLGKTFQAIVFTRLFFSLDCGRTALVIAPKRSVTPVALDSPTPHLRPFLCSTLGTWEREFSMWSSTLRSSGSSSGANPNLRLYRPGEEIGFSSRQALIDEWTEEGGVMVLSYQMFSSMIGESATEVRPTCQQ